MTRIDTTGHGASLEEAEQMERCRQPTLFGTGLMGT